MDTIDPSGKIAPGTQPARTLVSEKVETKGDRRGSLRYGPPLKTAHPPSSSKEEEQEIQKDERLVDIII